VPPLVERSGVLEGKGPHRHEKEGGASGEGTGAPARLPPNGHRPLKGLSARPFKDAWPTRKRISDCRRSCMPILKTSPSSAHMEGVRPAWLRASSAPNRP